MKETLVAPVNIGLGVVAHVVQQGVHRHVEVYSAVCRGEVDRKWSGV